MIFFLSILEQFRHVMLALRMIEYFFSNNLYNLVFPVDGTITNFKFFDGIATL